MSRPVLKSVQIYNAITQYVKDRQQMYNTVTQFYWFLEVLVLISAYTVHCSEINLIKIKYMDFDTCTQKNTALLSTYTCMCIPSLHKLGL